MLKMERQDSIVALCDKGGTVSVRNLSESLGISEMTVRRDLEELSQAGRLIRVHGGAKSCAPTRHTLVDHEHSHGEKSQLHRSQKEHAARLAASLIEADDSIYLGTGTTVEAMVAFLPTEPLRIVTSSLAVFMRLIDLEAYESGLYDLHLLGGSYHKSTMAFVGPWADDVMAKVGLNRTYVGANGIAGNSVFGHTVDAARLQQTAISVADNSYVVTDSSKFGRRDFSAFCKLSDLTAVVTDSKITPGQREEIEQFCSMLC